ncbi:MAG: hypothetical protein ACR2JB_13610 [Bryobacteraceae bacterium]
MATARATGRRIVMAARERLAVPALFAFAMSPVADLLYLAGGLLSYQDLLETENYREPLASFGWDLFRRTDLPLLAENESYGFPDDQLGQTLAPA